MALAPGENSRSPYDRLVEAAQREREQAEKKLAEEKFKELMAGRPAGSWFTREATSFRDNARAKAREYARVTAAKQYEGRLAGIPKDWHREGGRWVPGTGDPLVDTGLRTVDTHGTIGGPPITRVQQPSSAALANDPRFGSAAPIPDNLRHRAGRFDPFRGPDIGPFNDPSVPPGAAATEASAPTEQTVAARVLDDNDLNPNAPSAPKPSPKKEEKDKVERITEELDNFAKAAGVNPRKVKKQDKVKIADMESARTLEELLTKFDALATQIAEAKTSDKVLRFFAWGKFANQMANLLNPYGQYQDMTGDFMQMNEQRRQEKLQAIDAQSKALGLRLDNANKMLGLEVAQANAPDRYTVEGIPGIGTLTDLGAGDVVALDKDARQTERQKERDKIEDAFKTRQLDIQAESNEFNRQYKRDSRISGYLRDADLFFRSGRDTTATKELQSIIKEYPNALKNVDPKVAGLNPEAQVEAKQAIRDMQASILARYGPNGSFIENGRQYLLTLVEEGVTGAERVATALDDLARASEALASASGPTVRARATDFDRALERVQQAATAMHVSPGAGGRTAASSSGVDAGVLAVGDGG